MTILQPDTLTGHTLDYIKRYDTIIDAVELIDEQENIKINVPVFSEVEEQYYTTMSFDIDTLYVSYFRCYRQNII
jgi:negative regulator of genetic competence, sporulation and motility